MTATEAETLSSEPAPTAQPPRRRWFRRLLIALLAIAVLLGGWFVVARLTAPGRAIRVVSSTPPAPAPAAQRSVLRIGCWNIAHGRGLAEGNYEGGDADMRLARLHSIAEALKAADLDAVVINEIDFRTHWSHNINQAAFLAEEAGFPYRVEQCNLDASLPFWSLRIGNAILSRHPIEAAAMVDLPSPDRWEILAAGYKRGVVCTIRPADGPPFRLLGLHLDPHREPVRIASAEVVRELVDSSALPVIVAGDINSTRPAYPGSKPDASGRTAVQIVVEDEKLDAAPQIEPIERYFTFRADDPNRIIDWVLAPPQWRIVDYVVRPTDLSDHRMVIATIQPPTDD